MQGCKAYRLCSVAVLNELGKLVVNGQNMWETFTEKLALILPGKQRTEENEYWR